MKKFVKILLVVLAALIIAGAGFWGGTQFAYRQVAANTVNAAGQTASGRFGFNNQRGPGMMNRDGANKDGSGNNNFNRSQPGKGNFGPGMMGRNAGNGGMMNRFAGGFPGSHLLGGGFMLLGLLFPLGVAVLIVLGVIALFRVVRRPTKTAVAETSSAVCPKCGSPVQTGWTHCAHCGELL
ncbi:MAG TPA: zinc ribbon domain-containing protein [Leptolinea sp.]